MPRKTFYNDLQKALLFRKSNTIVAIAIDANAQTCFDPDKHPNVIGRHTKGDTASENGHHLIDFAAANDLFLTKDDVKKVHIDSPLPSNQNQG